MFSIVQYKHQGFAGFSGNDPILFSSNAESTSALTAATAMDTFVDNLTPQVGRQRSDSISVARRPKKRWSRKGGAAKSNVGTPNNPGSIAQPPAKRQKKDVNSKRQSAPKTRMARTKLPEKTKPLEVDSQTLQRLEENKKAVAYYKDILLNHVTGFKDRCTIRFSERQNLLGQTDSSNFTKDKAKKNFGRVY